MPFILAILLLSCQKQAPQLEEPFSEEIELLEEEFEEEMAEAEEEEYAEDWEDEAEVEAEDEEEEIEIEKDEKEEKEEKIYRLKPSQGIPVPGSWETAQEITLPSRLKKIIPPGTAPEEYIVQPGDTLSKICEQLLGDRDYWPEVWSLNPFIKNPHFIWPGMRLRFHPGGAKEAPKLEIVSHEEIIDPRFTKSITDQVLATIDSKYIIKKPAKKQKKSTKIQILGQVYSGKIAATVPGFIEPNSLDSLCTISKGLQGQTLLGSGELFLCKPLAPLEFGRTYTVVRAAQTSELYDLDGYLYHYVAQVQLRQIMGDGSLILGWIEKSRIPIAEGDFLIPKRSTSRLVTTDQDFALAETGIQGRIIGFAEIGRRLGGRGQTVFINKGAKDGFAQGQLLRIYQGFRASWQKLSNDVTAPGDSYPVGLLRIIDTTESGAVGYIVHNNTEILQGAVVGQKDKLSEDV